MKNPFKGISPTLYVVQGSCAETYAKQKQMSYQYFGIYLKETQQKLNVGDTKQNEVVNETGRNLTWSSSNPQVVSVDNNGKMQALKMGSAVITVTDGAEYSVSSNVQVIEDISKLTVASIKGQTYTGKAIKPEITVKNGNTVLCEGTDYTVSYKNNTNAGTATAVITGLGNYTGTVEKNFTIKALTLKTENVSLSKTSYTYNGKVQKPSVTVKDSKGKKLKKGTDYTVSYSKGCKNVGKYTVTIKFKGNYSGIVKKTFTIAPKSTSLSKLTAKKKGFTAKWKKLTSQTTGYQIQYSTSSKFTKKTTKTATISKNKTTSKTISKLKAKKKYYVRIRTYKTVKVNGKSTKIYSSWSKAKTVTTKK